MAKISRKAPIYGAEAMIKALGSRKDAYILDIGAGTGIQGESVIDIVYIDEPKPKHKPKPKPKIKPKPKLKHVTNN